MNDTILASLCDALGWQGGTLQAALVEVRRLVQIKAATKAAMDQLAFRAAVGGLKLNGTDQAKLAAVRSLYTPAEQKCSLTPLGKLVLDSNGVQPMNCRKCGMPVFLDEFERIGHDYPDSILDLGYCYSCSTAVVSEIEEEAAQDRTMNNPPQDEGDN